MTARNRITQNFLENYLAILRAYTGLIEDKAKGEKLSYGTELYLPNPETISNLRKEFDHAIKFIGKSLPESYIQRLREEYSHLEERINKLPISEKNTGGLIL